eukprot:gene31937-8934_t
MANLGMSPRPIDGWPVHEYSVNTIKALSCMLEVFDDEVNVLHIRNMDGAQGYDVGADRSLGRAPGGLASRPAAALREHGGSK